MPSTRKSKAKMASPRGWATGSPFLRLLSFFSANHLPLFRFLIFIGGVIGLAATTAAQPTGLAFYDDLSLLPSIYPNVQSYYLSSYDRTGGNDDGFRGTYSQLYVHDNGEHGNQNDTPANYSSLVYYYFLP